MGGPSNLYGRPVETLWEARRNSMGGPSKLFGRPVKTLWEVRQISMRYLLKMDVYLYLVKLYERRDEQPWNWDLVFLKCDFFFPDDVISLMI